MKLVHFFTFVAFFLLGTGISAQENKYKCLVQMKNYNGHEAYVVVSIVDSKNKYIKTVQVLGTDSKWYNTLKDWHAAQKKMKENFVAITGASIAGGNRAIKVMTIDNKFIDKGYKLRFETAVEDQKYVSKDVELTLSTTKMMEKVEGTEYIRFVKLSPIQ